MGHHGALAVTISFLIGVKQVRIREVNHAVAKNAQRTEEGYRHQQVSYNQDTNEYEAYP